jgi:hypothetical protein
MAPETGVRRLTTTGTEPMISREIRQHADPWTWLRDEEAVHWVQDSSLRNYRIPPHPSFPWTARLFV